MSFYEHSVPKSLIWKGSPTPKNQISTTYTVRFEMFSQDALNTNREPTDVSSAMYADIFLLVYCRNSIRFRKDMRFSQIVTAYLQDVINIYKTKVLTSTYPIPNAIIVLPSFHMNLTQLHISRAYHMQNCTDIQHWSEALKLL